MYRERLVRWEARLAAEDEPNKRQEAVEVGGFLAYPETAKVGSLAELEELSLSCASFPEPFFQSAAAPHKAAFSDGELRFRSALSTGDDDNDMVHASVFFAGRGRRAVLVLRHWNARDESYLALARALRILGLTVVLMTLPYHGKRRRKGQIIADYFLSANLGRTIRSVRQAVVDTRNVIDWLEAREFDTFYIAASSLGSCIGGLVSAFDERVTKTALLLTAGDFAEVVWTGSATSHIRASIEQSISLEQLQRIWCPISTGTYVQRLARQKHGMLLVSAAEDKVVLPYLTARFVDQLSRSGACVKNITVPCGHYTLAKIPFSVVALAAVGAFFRKSGS